MNWEPLISASLISGVVGSSLVGFIVRSFLTKSLKDLDDAVQKIIDLKVELAKVTERLESYEKTHDLIVKIDRKVAALEMRVYGSPKVK